MGRPSGHYEGEGAFEEDALNCLDEVACFALSLARNGDDADDLVQETYMRALRSRHTWRDGGNMRAWLFTICKNLFLTAERRTRDTVSIDGDPADEGIAAARLHNELSLTGDADIFDRIDVGPAIRRALTELLPVYRTVVVLVDVEGYGYSDAATMLEVPVGTVRSRLFRARRLLQETLRDHGRDAGFSAAALSERGGSHDDVT